MFKRTDTKVVKIGDLTLGGCNHVLIQSMCNIKTSKVSQVVRQINKCAALGADLMRVSVLDEKDAKSIKKIVENVSIPVIADIHYNYKLALLAIENGAKKIRLNPGNLRNIDEVKEVIKKAKKHNVAIRIGVNEGSITSKIKEENPNLSETDLIVKLALDYIKIFEENDFNNIVVSLKSSDVFKTIDAYKKFAEVSNYSLHIGLTESGFDEIGIIRSSATLGILLHEGLGNTIRVSLSSDPEKEVLTAKRLLHDLGLYENYPTLISCPTCGRTEVNNIKLLASKVLKYLEDNDINLKVAIMGCAINGIGEGKSADIGLAGGKDQYVLFKKGKATKNVTASDAYNELIKEINDLAKTKI